jgi:hypothetical protein
MPAETVVYFWFRIVGKGIVGLELLVKVVSQVFLAERIAWKQQQVLSL